MLNQKTPPNSLSVNDISYKNYFHNTCRKDDEKYEFSLTQVQTENLSTRIYMKVKKVQKTKRKTTRNSLFIFHFSSPSVLITIDSIYV